MYNYNMWNIFRKKNSKEQAKQAILKEFFSPSKQKKAIKKAAKESSMDQKMLIEKYNELKLDKKCS